MAMSRLRRTMMLMTENEPNMSSPKNLVNSLMPVNSKLSRSISPKMDHTKVWIVSHKLKRYIKFKGLTKVYLSLKLWKL